MTRTPDAPIATTHIPTTRPERTHTPDAAAIEAVWRKTRASVRAYHAEQHPEPTYAQRTAASQKQLRYRARKKDRA